MIIGYDAKRAVSNMTGLGNYSRLVTESIAERHPTWRLLLYTPKLKDNPRLSHLKDCHNVEFHLPPPQGFSGSLWRSWGLSNNLAADRVDIYHGLSNELPLNIRSAGVPSVVTVHDVIYRRLPHCYSAIDRLLYDFKYGRSCRNADRIIAVSRRTKDDIIHYYGIDPDKIDVIYQGCDDSFKKILAPEFLEQTRLRLGLPERYLLQVGTIERRKNLELSVRALSAIKDKEIHLVAVGKDRGYLGYLQKISEELGVKARIIYRHDITFADLPAVCQKARAILYPSLYEGFGIPVIEGLESMRPVIAATGSCLEEAGGDAAYYVNPDDPRQLAATIDSVLSEIKEGESIPQRVIAGKRYTSRFDNTTMAENIAKAYEKTIDIWRSRQ